MSAMYMRPVPTACTGRMAMRCVRNSCTSGVHSCATTRTTARSAPVCRAMSAVRLTSPSMRACVGSVYALLTYRVQVAGAAPYSLHQRDPSVMPMGHGARSASVSPSRSDETLYLRPGERASVCVQHVWDLGGDLLGSCNSPSLPSPLPYIPMGKCREQWRCRGGGGQCRRI